MIRARYQAQSLNHLVAATGLDPSSSSAFYHLAFCQAEARSIDAAIVSVRSALNIDSESVQAWHLLALLLTSQNDWTAAQVACETGVRVWESEESAEAKEDISPTPEHSDPAVEAHDFAASIPSQPGPEPSSEALLATDGSLTPLRTPPPPVNSRSKRLEEVINLRMTLNIIIEKLQGPDIALAKQADLFAFFSARSGSGRAVYGYRGGMQGIMSLTSVGGLGGSYVSVADPEKSPITNGSMVHGGSDLCLWVNP